MDISLLETLRYKMATAASLADVFEYFFDHFGEEPDFFAKGAPTQNDLLLETLRKIGGQIFKTDKVRLENLRLIRIEEYNFIHGGMTMNGAVANVLYCDDLQVGVVVVHRPKVTPPTQFVRFSAQMLAPNFAAEASKFKH